MGVCVFDYNGASDTFTPGTMAGTPPQGNDAKCGFACHTRAKARDYVFTEYGNRRTAHSRGSEIAGAFSRSQMFEAEQECVRSSSAIAQPQAECDLQGDNDQSLNVGDRYEGVVNTFV
jgi:hypothetical protein